MAALLSPPVPKDQKLPQSFSKLSAVKQELSFEFIKGQLFHGRLESVECEELTRNCSKLQLKTSAGYKRRTHPKSGTPEGRECVRYESESDQ